MERAAGFVFALILSTSYFALCICKLLACLKNRPKKWTTSTQRSADTQTGVFYKRGGSWVI